MDDVYTWNWWTALTDYFQSMSTPLYNNTRQNELPHFSRGTYLVLLIRQMCRVLVKQNQVFSESFISYWPTYPKTNTQYLGGLGAIVANANVQSMVITVHEGQWGMLTTFPQYNFALEFQEILSQNNTCYHWLSVSGSSKIMYCGILINMPYYLAWSGCANQLAGSMEWYSMILK